MTEVEMLEYCKPEVRSFKDYQPPQRQKAYSLVSYRGPYGQDLAVSIWETTEHLMFTVYSPWSDTWKGGKPARLIALEIHKL